MRPTPKYREVHRTLKAAALRLPDTCLNESASRVAGAGGQSQLIFQTNCGPWLGEIEKALSASGFKVYSWDALAKLEKQRGLSPYNAGRELGADVVFMLNSLEASDIVECVP